MPTENSSVLPILPTILELPYDILLRIIVYLSAHDIIRLFSTCRSLYTLTKEDAVWRHLCTRYGVRDVTYFGGRSFFAVYTGLLHTYGPLIGLWANDAPYIGNILEFYVDPGGEGRPAGILGEIWRFRPLEPEEIETPETVELPTYAPVIWIGFDAEEMARSLQLFPPSGSSSSAPAGFFCIATDSGSGGSSRLERSTLSLVSGSRQGLYVHSRDGQFVHPDFPESDAGQWLDVSRDYPRLRPVRQEAIDQTEHISRILRPRVPVVYTIPTIYVRPIALSIAASRSDIYSNRPIAGCINIIPFTPRFYPLDGRPRRGIEPWSDDWMPESLVGLWFGTYGPHGTECAYVSWDPTQKTLSAWKITGDENVPRGAVTWTCRVSVPHVIPDAQLALYEQSFGDLDRCRIFSGDGTMSARGYMPHQLFPCPLVLGVIGADELRVLWDEPEDELSTYMRFSGRDY